MIIIEQPSEVLKFSKLQRNKIMSMKDHLETLLRKKYRLEVEIKSLRKAIKQRTTMTEKSIKVSINAESTSTSDYLSNSERLQIQTEYPDLYQELAELSNLELELNSFLEEIDLLESEL